MHSMVDNHTGTCCTHLTAWRESIRSSPGRQYYQRTPCRNFLALKQNLLYAEAPSVLLDPCTLYKFVCLCKDIARRTQALAAVATL